MTAGSSGRSAARLRGAIGPVIPPPAVLSFWQKLGVVTPQHQLQEKTRVIPNKFGDGYQQTAKDGLTPIDRTLTLTWNPLERGDADQMLLFFRTYAGIPLTFVAPRDTGPRHWLAISWQRTAPQPHADGVTVEFQERLYVERSLSLHIAGSGDPGMAT
jgi:phage-related protein